MATGDHVAIAGRECPTIHSPAPSDTSIAASTVVSVSPPGTLTRARSNGATATVAMTAANTARASMREATGDRTSGSAEFRTAL